MKHPNILFLLCLAMLMIALSACGNGASLPLVDGDMDFDEEQLEENEGDREEYPEDGDTSSDGDEDIESETESDEGEMEEESPWLKVPFLTPPIEKLFIDVEYVQEFNHTTNELEAGIGELVSVLIPPTGLGGYEEPTQITARGLVTHNSLAALQIVTIEEHHPDLIAAAFCSRGLLLAGADRLYVHSDGALQAIEVPAHLTVTGLASGKDRIYILTDGGLGMTNLRTREQWPEAEEAVTAVLETADTLFVGTARSVSAYTLLDGVPYHTADWTFDIEDGMNVGSVAALVADVSLPQELGLVLVGSDGLLGLDLSGLAPAVVEVPEFADGRVPLGQARAASLAVDGGFIVAGAHGAYRIMDRGIGPEWRVYPAERWLPSDDVRALATDPGSVKAPIYFATALGLATVTFVRWSIEDKLQTFVDRIVQRHDRDGAVADSHLTERGDLSTNIPWDSDNDGGWTAYWLLAECFRYKVKGDPDAKAHFDKSLDRMLSLRTLTGTEHFLARSVIRKEGCRLDDCDDPDDGEWFTSPDGKWWVKGDTSNDEVTSHMFMMGHAYDLCADEEQQERIRAHVDGIVGGLVDNDFQLIDLDGEVTTYGQFDPVYVNEEVSGRYGDGGLRSVQMLANLTLAHYLTQDQRYLDAKDLLIAEHHYDENAVNESDYPFRAGQGTGDGNELVTQAFVPLLRYEFDPELRLTWIQAWRNTYDKMKAQQGALWDLVNGLVAGDNPDSAFAGRWLQTAPMDMIRWHIHNQNRLDLVPAPDYYESDRRIRSDGFIVPYDERPNDRWNTDQFKVNGGLGPYIEMDGADVLLPYWMGRYYRLICTPI